MPDFPSLGGDTSDLSGPTFTLASERMTEFHGELKSKNRNQNSSRVTRIIGNEPGEGGLVRVGTAADRSADKCGQVHLETEPVLKPVFVVSSDFHIRLQGFQEKMRN